MIGEVPPAFLEEGDDEEDEAVARVGGKVRVDPLDLGAGFAEGALAGVRGAPRPADVVGLPAASLPYPGG